MKMNKTLMIRQAANDLILEGKLPRPKDIIKILSEKGVKVTSPQVTMACRGTGLMLKEFRSGPEEGRESFGLDELRDAQDFMRRVGGLDNAMKIFSLAAKLKDSPAQNPGG